MIAKPPLTKAFGYGRVADSYTRHATRYALTQGGWGQSPATSSSEFFTKLLAQLRRAEGVKRLRRSNPGSGIVLRYGFILPS